MAPTREKPLMTYRSALLLVALLGVGLASPVLAYKPGRPKIIALSEPLVRKVIACYAAAERAENRATGGSSGFYKNRTRLREAALARCGFPKSVLWRHAVYSVRMAAEDLKLEAPLDELRAANRLVAAPFRGQLGHIFVE